MLQSFPRAVCHTLWPIQLQVVLSSGSSWRSQKCFCQSSIGYPICLGQYLYLLLQSLFFSSFGRNCYRKCTLSFLQTRFFFRKTLILFHGEIPHTSGPFLKWRYCRGSYWRPQWKLTSTVFCGKGIAINWRIWDGDRVSRGKCWIICQNFLRYLSTVVFGIFCSYSSYWTAPSWQNHLNSANFNTEGPSNQQNIEESFIDASQSILDRDTSPVVPFRWYV